MGEQAGEHRGAASDARLLLWAGGFDADGLAAARTQVRQRVVELGLSEDQRDAFIAAVNEAMTNAVRHGGGHGKVRLWRAGALVCEVCDQGSGFAAAGYSARTRRPEPSATGGMGLWLAREMSESFTIDSGDDGTTVTIEAALPGQEADA